MFELQNRSYLETTSFAVEVLAVVKPKLLIREWVELFSEPTNAVRTSRFTCSLSLKVEGMINSLFGKC